MKKLFSVMAMAMLMMSILPVVFAADVGVGIGIDIITEDFEPLVWACDSRVVLDDATEPGRFSGPGDPLLERINNYAFEGEQIVWDILVMDKNGIEKIVDVYGTVGDVQGAGNPIEVNCQRTTGPSQISDSCNARILEEKITTFDADTMDYYKCTLTVETPVSMQGEHWITVEAVDLDDLSGIMAENEYWFLNPIIGLAVSGDLVFDDGVRPGTDSYSETILVENNAEMGSGVMMDMFITGTDFYDSTSSGAACPTTNQLGLESFRYFATNGAYSTRDDFAINNAGSVTRTVDAEGYVNIEYGIGFNNPSPFYDDAEILQAQPVGPYWTANVLAPGAEMALTFKLSLPEPCNGDFDTGSINFWGEAI